MTQRAIRWTGSSLLGLGLLLVSGQQAAAGTFQSDFNTGVPPAGMNLFGNAWEYDHSTGGINNSGVLKLTTAVGSQGGGMILDDFDNGETIAGFEATFQLYIGSGNGADGFSFFYGDFNDGAHGEEGPGTIRGLTIAFDVYNSGGTPPEAPAIDIKWNNQVVYHRLVGATGTTTPASPIGSATTIRTQPTSGGAPVYWPVKVRVDTDGTLDLVYNNVVIATNLPVFQPLTEAPMNGYRFGMSARTGGSYDAHWVDDLKIQTFPLAANSGQPSVVTVSPQPMGSNAGAAGGVEVVFADSTYTIDTTKVTMRYNNTVVTPTITQADGRTRIAYRGNNGVLPTGAATVSLTYSTTSTPAFENTFSFNFVVDPFATLPESYAVASVDTSKPGFRVRGHQFYDWLRAPGEDRNQLILAERELALGYIDPATGQPYSNGLDLSAFGADGYYDETGVLNYQGTGGGSAGNFTASSNPSRPDAAFPGLGAWGTDNFALEFTMFIELKAGGNRFGFHSDDGFRASFGPGLDVTSSVIAGSYNGGRNGETLFDVVVPRDGYYPLRISYWNGTGGVNAEFYWIDPDTGARVLVNDPDNLKAPRIYRASTVSRPSITRALPVQNWIGAAADADVLVEITDGAIPVTASSIALSINNVAQTVTTSKSGNITTVKRTGSLSNLLPSGLNTVRVVYGFNENGSPVTLTNTYAFSVAPYYGVLPPNNRVTSVGGNGFIGRVHQMDKSLNANQGDGARINGGGDSNRMPHPEIQLTQGNINPTNGLPYPNLAQVGPNGNYTFPFDVINWQYNNAAADVAQSGWFRNTVPATPLPGANPDIGVPGLPGTGTSYGGLENAVMEITTYLELTRGVHTFGFNSDDGFIAISGPSVNDTLGTLLGFFNGGRGNSSTLVAPSGQNPPLVHPNVGSGSTLFNVIVPEAGIYPFRILYWQGGTGINAEFYSINKLNGMALLVGDTAADPSGIKAYSTYNGPARPYVKFSVAPNPWDNAYQQVGPGPIRMVGRTRNAVNSSDIYNMQNTTYFVRPWANIKIGGVIGNGTSANDLGLVLNGQPVPVTLTTNGTDVTVVYQPNPPLPSGSTNTAGLVYAGTTNYWTFTVQPWTTLNAADSRPLSDADPNSRGFRVKVAQTASTTGFTQNSVTRAEAQLAGTLGPNAANPGTGPDGAFIYTNIINWNNNVQTSATGTQLGNFQANNYGAGTGWPFPFYTDEPIPGVPGTGLSNTDNTAAEVFAWLEFPTAGYYRFGVNSDDAFGMKVGTPGVTNGTVIFGLDFGKGSSDIPVSFVVPQPGLYPIRLIYYNGGGGGNLEYFTYDEAGNKIPVNDRNNPNAIKAYYAIASVSTPSITGATTANGNITIIWVNGGTLESAPSLNGPWTSTGDSDGSFTEPATGAMKFYRVRK